MKKSFKKLFASLFSTSLFFTPLHTTQASEIETISRAFSYAVAEDPTKTISGGGAQINIYKIATDGTATLLVEDLYPDGGPGTFSADQYAVNSADGKIYFREPPRGGDLPLRARVFDVKTETLADDWVTISGLPDGATPIFVTMPNTTKDQINKKCTSSDGSSCDSGTSKIITLGGEGTEEVAKIDNTSVSVGGSTLAKKNADGSIQIGADGNDIDITSEGLSVDGTPMITKKSDGNIHIGKNSLITPVEHSTLSDGRKVHHLWAEDDTNTKIPLNIYGSDLLINGVSVQGQIDENKANISTNTSKISTNTSNIKKLGEGVAGSTALTAALSALPQTSKESKLSCGVGTGAYSSKYALGFGCASKVNDRVDVNAGGSYVFGGSKSYGEGTLDSGVIKAGFVFKLGKLNQSTQISMKDKQKLTNEITDLKSENKNLNQKISKFETEKFELLARLERLEKVALGESKSKDLANIKLP